MGASILPTTIINGKLYFLFGKERDVDDTPGWSDFGGGTDKGESYISTAIREGGEELTGFLGSDKDLKKMLTKHGTYNIDYNSNNHNTYRVHIFPMNYDKYLPYYYNNNQKFLQKRLDQNVIKNSKIFEKAEIKWICVDELRTFRSKFRSFYQNIVDIIISKQNDIKNFIKKKMPYYNKKNVSSKYTMGLEQSMFNDEEEEPVAVVVEEVKKEKESTTKRFNGRKSRRNVKSGQKTRRVRFNKAI